MADRKLLKEFNKKSGTSYGINLRIRNATVIHFSDGRFLVTFISSENNKSQRLNLSDFIDYEISSSLPSKLIRDFIYHKEEKELNVRIEIAPPSKIRYAYLQANYYANGVGQLGKSCMRARENQKALNFYVKNNAKVVIAIDENHKIHARALLWDNVKSTQRKTPFIYLDRVYVKSDSLLPLFYKLAEANGWKYYDSTSAGEAKGGYYIDNIDITNMCHFPYTDTFRYLYYKDNIVSSSKMSSKVKHMAGDYVCLNQASNGGYFPQFDPDRVREALSGNYVSKKDSIFVKRYNAWVLKTNIANINGAYYSALDNTIIKTKADGYILKENSTVEVFTGETIDKNKAVYSDKYKGYIHKSNIVYIKDEIYHSFDTEIVHFDKKWYHISQCFVNYDRKELNEEMAKRPKFSCPGTYEVWVPYATVTRKDSLIPKERAIIAYNLVYNSVLDKLEYQKVYLIEKEGLIQLTTGEFIISTSENRRYLKKFNNKYYIKQEFKPPNKNQLTLF